MNGVQILRVHNVNEVIQSIKGVRSAVEGYKNYNDSRYSTSSASRVNEIG